MASVNLKRRHLSKAKTLCKLLLICLVFFICIQFFRWYLFSETVPSVGSSLDDKIQNFKYNPAVAGKDAASVVKDSSGLSKSKLDSLWSFVDDQENNAVHALIIFTHAKYNKYLQMSFESCAISISLHTSVPVVIFLLGDRESFAIAKKMLTYFENIQLKFVDLDMVMTEMEDVIRIMQPHFSYRPDSYYGQSLFFLSTAIHRLAPSAISRLIMLDCDVLFKDDIKHLYNQFELFTPTNVIGIAYENQPVYRHILATYRKAHPGTKAGSPPPKGFPGFNSGVLLMDLNKLRRSELYNSLLNSDIVKNLTEKYFYHGHLGDQDFYSLVSFEYQELFYVLPCIWNRQLCEWWRDKGYRDVFDQYFKCSGEVKVYHGNCHTRIPSEYH